MNNGLTNFSHEFTSLPIIQQTPQRVTAFLMPILLKGFLSHIKRAKKMLTEISQIKMVMKGFLSHIDIVLNSARALPVFAFLSPSRGFVAAPSFLHAQFLAISASRYPFQLQLLSPWHI